MKTFQVTLSRSVREYLTVEVSAENKGEAAKAARKEARDNYDAGEWFCADREGGRVRVDRVEEENGQ